MRRPSRDRIVIVDARGRENRLGELGHRDIFLLAGKHLRRPRRAGIGDDVPVDVEAGDFLERRLVGDGIGFVGARDLGRVLAGKQHRIVADDGEPRGVVGEGLRDAVIEPAGGAVEAHIRREPIARQRDFLIGEDRGDEARAGPIGVFGDPPHQRQRLTGAVSSKSCPALKPQPDLDGGFGQSVEFYRIDRCGRHCDCGWSCESGLKEGWSATLARHRDYNYGHAVWPLRAIGLGGQIF